MIQLTQKETEGWTERWTDGQTDGQKKLEKSPVGQPLFGTAKRRVDLSRGKKGADYLALPLYL